MGRKDDFTADVYMGSVRRSSYLFCRASGQKGMDHFTVMKRYDWVPRPEQSAKEHALLRALEKALSGIVLEESEAPRD